MFRHRAVHTLYCTQDTEPMETDGGRIHVFLTLQNSVKNELLVRAPKNAEVRMRIHRLYQKSKCEKEKNSQNEKYKMFSFLGLVGLSHGNVVGRFKLWHLVGRIRPLEHNCRNMMGERV